MRTKTQTSIRRKEENGINDDEVNQNMNRCHLKDFAFDMHPLS